MNKFIDQLTEWGSVMNKIVISILFVNCLLILFPGNIKQAIFFNTSRVNFSKYSFIICFACALIIIISVVKRKIKDAKSKKNKKYYS